MDKTNRKKIIEFYGGGCHDCIGIAPAVAKLEKEEGVIVEKLEVWHNEKNRKRMEALQPLYDKECGGNLSVPSFYDEDGQKLICEPVVYQELYDWVFSFKP